MTQYLTTLTLAAYGGPPWRDGDWHAAGGHLGFFIGRLVVFALIVALVWWLVRRARRHAPVVAGRRVLAERFARGEIDAEEYRQRWAALAGPTRRRTRSDS